MSIQTTREYVNTLSNDTMLTMISDHIEYEKVGSIGDSVLRNQAETYLKHNDKPVTWLAMWMDRLMFDVYRRIAMEKLQESVKNNP